MEGHVPIQNVFPLGMSGAQANNVSRRSGGIPAHVPEPSPIVCERSGGGSSVATVAAGLDAVPQFDGLSKGFIAPGQSQQIARVGFEKNQLCDPRAQARRCFHRKNPPKRTADEIEQLRIVGDRRLDHASLVVRSLRPLIMPGRRFSVAGEIDRVRAIAILHCVL
jgi:hypothetical protein